MFENSVKSITMCSGSSQERMFSRFFASGRNLNHKEFSVFIELLLSFFLLCIFPENLQCTSAFEFFIKFYYKLCTSSLVESRAVLFIYMSNELLTYGKVEHVCLTKKFERKVFPSVREIFVGNLINLVTRTWKWLVARQEDCWITLVLIIDKHSLIEIRNISEKYFCNRQTGKSYLEKFFCKKFVANGLALAGNGKCYEMEIVRRWKDGKRKVIALIKFFASKSSQN